LDPNNPWKNEGFTPQNMGEITPKNEGFGFPWKLFFQPQQLPKLPRYCWIIGCISIGFDAGPTERKCHRVSPRWGEDFSNEMEFEGK